MIQGNQGQTLTEQLLLFADGPPGETSEMNGLDTSPTVVLNPAFVEALMGFPRGWRQPETRSCDVWETPLFRNVPRSSGG